MRSWLVVGSVALAAVGFFGACSSEKESDPLATSDGFCKEWSKKACSEPVQTQCASSSEQECRNSQENFCLGLVDEDAYDKSGAKDCLAAVEDAYEDGDLTGEERDTVLFLAGDCSGVLTGDGETGDSCFDELDCNTANDFHCVRRLDEPSGECHVPVEISGGGRCNDDDEVCVAGFYCDEDRNCLALKEEGDECSDTVPCESDLNCVVAEDAGVGVCTPKIRTGRECETDWDCETGICRQGTSSKICAPIIPLDIDVEICDDFR